jgi:8-oxo-dGTP pyrophosphatase MutT (NUDIX family)
MTKKIKIMVSQSKSKFGTAWAVIRDPSNGKYLICRRGPTANNAGQWGFPGGGVDEGEMHIEACARETWEEIQVRLAVKNFHAVAHSPDSAVIWFEVFKLVQPKATEEVDQFKWVHPYDLYKYTLHKSIKDYFKALRLGAKTL